MSGIERFGFGRTAPTPATIVVATSTSSTKSQLDADYTCDGVSDQVEINQALSSLPSTGGTVLLLEGTYVISASIEIPANTTLMGVGFATVIQVRANHDADLTMITNDSGASGDDNISIRDLRIDGNEGNQSSGFTTVISFTNCDDVIFETLLIKDVRGTGISLSSGCDRAIIRHLNFSNILSKAIYVDDPQQTLITKNIIDNAGLGIEIDDSAASGSGKHNVISYNIIRGGANSTGATYGAEGIHVIPDYSIISGNQIYDSGKEGIKSEGAYSLITSNRVEGSGQLADDTYANILIATDDEQCAQMNYCRKGGTTNEAKYGIHVTSDTCFISNNDLLTGGASGAIQDDGAGTITAAGNRA